MVIATFKYVAQTAATTFAFPSVWFLFYGMHCTRLTSSHIYSQWGTPDVVRACIADMTLYICAVRHPWRGACTLTGRGVCATCASTTSPSSSPARAACLWPTVAPPAGKRSDLCNDDIQNLVNHKRGNQNSGTHESSWIPGRNGKVRLE